MRTFIALLLLWLSVGAAVAASSGVHRGVNLNLELLSEQAALTGGGVHTLALRIEHDPHWHTYWQNPGDSGLPTQVRWTLPAGFQIGEIQWPYPQRLPVGPLVNFGFEGETWLLLELRAPAALEHAPAAIEIGADVSYLVCQEECIPGNASLRLSLPVAETPQLDGASAAGFAQARSRLPTPRSDWQGSVTDSGDHLHIALRGELPTQFELFPAVDAVFANQAFAGWTRDGNGLSAEHARNDSYAGLPERIPMLLVDRSADPARAYAFELTPAADPAAVAPVIHSNAAAADPPTTPTSPRSLLMVLLLAFAGGVILNLMPCVLPVLSIKALGLTRAGGDRQQARREGLLYTLGVLASFAVIGGALLALRAGGERVGWGFQLQSPAVVAGLVYLMFLLGLNLSGATTVGSGWMNLGHKLTQGGGDRAAFFTGVLACVVAAPCTAPFMGAALGYALTQPPLAAMTVFLALGLGLAAPLTAIALIPALARRLPRPGAWMETFKQALAFPLYLTAVWLLWVLAQQTGADGVALILIGVILLAFAAWLWERAKARGARLPQALALISLLLALALLPMTQRLLASAASVADDGSAWQPWTQARLDALRAQGTPVLVNMTAAWCITCLANERVALSSDAFHERLRQHGIAYLKGDWTRHDEAISGYLATFERVGVPLYVVYPRGPGPQQVLPQILTPATVLAALDRAAGAR